MCPDNGPQWSPRLIMVSPGRGQDMWCEVWGNTTRITQSSLQVAYTDSYTQAVVAFAKYIRN